MTKIKYLFQYDLKPITAEQQIIIDNHLTMEDDLKFCYRNAKDKYMFEYLRAMCESNDTVISDALCAMLAFNFSTGVASCELYAKTLSRIRRMDKLTVVKIKDFLNHFHGIPDRAVLSLAHSEYLAYLRSQKDEMLH